MEVSGLAHAPATLCEGILPLVQQEASRASERI